MAAERDVGCDDGARAFRQRRVVVGVGFALPLAAPCRRAPAQADQYRVTEDFWDSWEDEYTSGLRSKLDVAVEFAA